MSFVDSDFEVDQSSLTFSGEVTRVCLNVMGVPDGIVELDEMLSIRLSSNDPALTLSDPTIAVTIIDSSPGNVNCDFVSQVESVFFIL